MVSAISDWVGSLSLGLNGQCSLCWPSVPIPNGRLPSETGGHISLLQRFLFKVNKNCLNVELIKSDKMRNYGYFRMLSTSSRE